MEVFDSAQKESLSRLAPGITARGLEQAGLLYAMGGVALASAKAMAPGAHLASLTEAAPKVKDLLRAGEQAGLWVADDGIRAFNGMGQKAWQLYKRELGTADVQKADQCITKCAERAQEDWNDLKAGTKKSGAPSPASQTNCQNRQKIAARVRGVRVLTESRKGATCEAFRTKWADRLAPRG